MQQLRLFSKSVARKEQPTSGRKHAPLYLRAAAVAFSKKHSTFWIVSAARHRNVKTFRSALMDRSAHLVFLSALFAAAPKKCATRRVCFLRGLRDKQLINKSTPHIQARSASFFEPHVTRARDRKSDYPEVPYAFF